MFIVLVDPKEPFCMISFHLSPKCFYQSVLVSSLLEA